MRKGKGCLFQMFALSAVHALVCLVRALVRVSVWVLCFFGLWAVALYLLFGLGLFVFFGFDPLSFEPLSCVYLSGLGLSVFLALLLSFRHMVGDPLKKIAASFRRFASVPAGETVSDPIPKKRRSAEAGDAPESPRVYLSALEPDTLINEYCDRFEVFSLRGGTRVLKKVEYKDD